MLVYQRVIRPFVGWCFFFVEEKLDTIIGVVVLLNSLTMVMELECEGPPESAGQFQPPIPNRIEGTNMALVCLPYIIGLLRGGGPRGGGSLIFPNVP